MNPPCTRKTQRTEDIHSICPDCYHPTGVHPFEWRDNINAPEGVCAYCALEPTEVGEIGYHPAGGMRILDAEGTIKLIAMSDGTVRWRK